MKFYVIVSVVSMLALLSTAFAPAGPSYKYTSDEGKMSVKFPAEFQSEVEEKENLTTVKVSTQMGETLFFASYTKHQLELEDHENLAGISLESFQETTGAALKSRENWKVKKHMGQQAVFEIEGKEVMMHYRVVLAGNIQYQLVVAGPKGSIDSKAKDRFFKSFKIMN